MRPRFMLLAFGFLTLMLLLPFRATASEAGSALEAESSKSGVIMVAGGRGHGLALKQDGTVWAWGLNYNGQLGEDQFYDRYTPIQVQRLGSVIAIAAGNEHSLALDSDGTVWAWGNNASGQLGDGSGSPGLGRYAPNQIKNFSSVVAIDSGANYNLALKSDGSVWAWGANSFGQLGNGTTIERHTPVQVQGLDSVVAISAGTEHSMALKSDGTVWAWGNNTSGQLGDGTTTHRYVPVQVQGINSAVSIATGGSHSLAVKSDGTVWAWGNNTFGQLGDETTIERHTPVQVQGLGSVTAIAAGIRGGHTLAVKSDGTVWAWGNNASGQLGDGSNINRSSPVQVTNLDSVSAITAGTSHSFAVKRDGTVRSWGLNNYGQLGDGSKTSRSSPVTIAAFNPVPYAETLLYRFDGTILDFDQNYILWKRTGDKMLWLYNRADKSQVMVYDSYGTEDKVNQAMLSDDGVIYTLVTNGVPVTYYWKQGTVLHRWEGQTQYDTSEKPNGTVVYTLYGTTYLYSTQESKLLYSFSGSGKLEYREIVFSGPGDIQYPYGAWYRVDGGALYGIRI
ncbi:RCC1 domain-containing protein [Paenibacillus sacheonensis]|uniref:RCC1-like domain-containing protein n=1 Tax=Paenibacillus sacheonensis TaxID=742054 RepID=A0A7X4YW09_9BACL|nr:hypothetical protein [Paenibacillus sacheonensis]MBM7569509.1 alpha-tubulin suppressor-like RCC1 family protein [Paenibacillus sacheonensis]NBC73572.1 hypothetical protein [Paenibacillus sacheonensis]